MYKAKDEGRNRYALFDESVRRRSVVRLAMEGELRQALSRHEFEVYYQPVVDPAGGRPLGAEALVRWHHPDQRPCPATRLHTRGRGLRADQAGRPLGLRTSRLPAGSGGTRKVTGPFSIFSPSTCRPGNWTTRRPPTWSATCSNATGSTRGGYVPRSPSPWLWWTAPPTRQTLDAFRELGLQVAIDDFGTGYSSLAYLHTLPVTTVKVDRSFVERLGGADDSTPVVKAVIDMGHAMGLSVVAEGVSTSHLGARVSSMGCDAAQGFYWARPAPAGDFADWWRKAARPPTRGAAALPAR